MIEALLVFGSMLMLLWVLRALDKAFRSGTRVELGLLELMDSSASNSADADRGASPSRSGRA